MSFLIKGRSLVFRQTTGVGPVAEVDGGGTPVVLTPHLISGRSEIFRQASGIDPAAEVDGFLSPVVIGPHLIAGKGQIYRVPPGSGCDVGLYDSWSIYLNCASGPGSPSIYEGDYSPLTIPPFIQVTAQGADFGIMGVQARTYLSGPLTFPMTPTLTITDTNITMTVQGHSVTASYAAGTPGPVPPPDFATAAYEVSVTTEFLPPCGVSYENVIGNATNFGGGGPISGTGGTSYPGPWTGPFVGQATFLEPHA
jgi:hypothetical protein